MKQHKNQLLAIATKIETAKRISPDELHLLLSFIPTQSQAVLARWLKQVALPASLALGFFYTVFPQFFASLAQTMPEWTNFSPSILTGVDYLWDLLGEPVRKANIVYHVPNIMLYSFGIFGIKKLFDALDKRTWRDRVLASQTKLKQLLTEGTLPFALTKGHSILFIGKGDFIGRQFVLSHTPSDAVSLSENKPDYTDIWNYYDPDSLYENLKQLMHLSHAQNAGEYVFFPVKDDQIFLPSESAFDLSPHKLDIICQNIRSIEKENKWPPKRIIIVGDRDHKSLVKSVDEKSTLRNSADTISLATIAKKYKQVTLLDPTDIVLKRILAIADGKTIVFRATQHGIKEYKTRFYERLHRLGYKRPKRNKGILTIGYDVFEDQTEQQALRSIHNDYYPVVLSKSLHDALLRNGYKKSEFLYVPQLVLSELSKTAAEQ
jgi:hypothetical protein